MGMLQDSVSRLQWKWILVQVIGPLVGPIILSAIVALLWTTGKPDFAVDWSIVVDVTPWALIFFSLTLIGSAINELWSKIPQHVAVSVSLLFLASQSGSMRPF